LIVIDYIRSYRSSSSQICTLYHAAKNPNRFVLRIRALILTGLPVALIAFMVADVFLSHTPEDDSVANRVRDFLEGQGVKCWSAPQEAESEGFEQGIKTCTAFILLFSHTANESNAIHREADLAAKLGKLLIPFRIENVPPTEALELIFRRSYWHDACTPPLERHLEEIMRLLRPLTFKRTPEATEEAILSRTLPSRVLIVRSGTGEKSTGLESSGPLRLSFNFDRPIISGQSSSFDLTVQNEGLENFREIEVTLENRNLKQTLTRKWPEIGVGKMETARLELEPFRSGESILHVIVTLRAGPRMLTFTGSRPLRINETPSAHELSTGPGWLLDALRRAGASRPAGGRFSSLQDLLNFKLPENREGLELTLAHEIEAQAVERAASSQVLELPAAFLGVMQPGTKLTLEPVKALTATPHQSIRLVARPTFSLGRSPEEADFLTWFWPRSEVHDTKTRRLSKKHCSLMVQAGKINVYNTAAASLTTFDGQDLTGAQGVLLERRGTLNLSGIYFLDVVRFSSHSSRAPTVSNLSEWAGAETKADISTVPGCVRFLALTPHVLPQHAAWLLTDGTFGTSQANPIVLDLHGLDEIQGRFYHYLGCFWLENLVENGAVQINDRFVAPGSIVPLANGQKIKLGERQFHALISA
jgi:hypothetical protein